MKENRVQIRGGNGFKPSEAMEKEFETGLTKLDQYLNYEYEVVVLCKVYDDKHRVEITIRTKGVTARVEQYSEDMYDAFNAALKKLIRTIKKQKNKINDKRNREVFKKHIEEELDLDLDELADELVVGRRVKNHKLEILDPDEAEARMELTHHDFYAFIKKDSGEVAICYRRKNGGYGLIITE